MSRREYRCLIADIDPLTGGPLPNPNFRLADERQRADVWNVRWVLSISGDTPFPQVHGAQPYTNYPALCLSVAALLAEEKERACAS